MNAVVNFKTPPTIGRFMLDNSFIRFIIGPVGSGKSVGCIMELLRRAREQAPDGQGVRRTRFAIVRNTLQQIKQTCLADIEMWIKPIAHYKVTDQAIHVRLALSDGTKVESEWLLMPLDYPEDQKRLLSLNLTGAWVSEFREIPIKIIDGIVGRLGRFPAKAIAPLTWHGLIGESNPPDEDSEWFMKLEVDTPPNWCVFKQPGGMEPTAENRDNLRDGYYEDLVASNTPDWVDVHVHAKYGKSLSGQAVFRSTFRPEFHVSSSALRAVPGISLMIGQDFGRTPASLISQVDPRGRLLILREVTSVDMGIEKFCIQTLRPTLLNEFIGFLAYMTCDPSGKFKGQIGEESPFDVLKRLGFKTYPAPTNDLEPRLRAVEQAFLRQIDGGPMVLIDGVNCPQLVQALKFNYRYKRKQNGVLDEAPDKNHPWSDLADCLQYLCLSVNGGYIGKLIARERPVMRGPRVSVASWT
jgi:hypothetical protein